MDTFFGKVFPKKAIGPMVAGWIVRGFIPSTSAPFRTPTPPGSEAEPAKSWWPRGGPGRFDPTRKRRRRLAHFGPGVQRMALVSRISGPPKPGPPHTFWHSSSTPIDRKTKLHPSITPEKCLTNRKRKSSGLTETIFNQYKPLARKHYKRRDILFQLHFEE